jgi:hypothetical protein
MARPNRSVQRIVFLNLIDSIYGLNSPDRNGSHRRVIEAAQAGYARVPDTLIDMLQADAPDHDGLLSDHSPGTLSPAMVIERRGTRLLIGLVVLVGMTAALWATAHMVS